MNKRQTTQNQQRDKLIDHWDRTIQLLPGYDPVATARKEHYFDYKAAQRVVDFFATYLQFVEGKEVVGQPFILEPWCQALVGNLFGWKVTETELRRYREGMLGVGRGNIKTTLGAGIVLYVLFCDGEARAQIYSMAADRPQAGLAFDIAKLMIGKSPSLASRCKPYRSSIVLESSASFYKAISAEAFRQHGYKPHVVLSDETHAQPNRDLYDVMLTGMVTRSQPFMLHLTTSDFDREASICNEIWDMACEVRDGRRDDPLFLPAIYEADKGAAYDDEKQWAKANPNLGKSVRIEILRGFAERAKHDLAWRSTFKRLHMNLRTEVAIEIIPMEDWDACAFPVDEDELVGRTCYAGLDLSCRDDLTAWVLLFEPDQDGEPWAILPRLFCPRTPAIERQATNRWPYLKWEAEGHLFISDGDVIDYDAVEQQIIKDCERFGMREAAVDPNSALHLQQRVMGLSGVELVNYPQGFRGMTEPIKELLCMLKGRQIAHGGNPVLRWMAQGCTAKQNEAGHIMFIKPTRNSKQHKIDGMVALVMALGMAMNSDDRGSDYVKQGLGAM